MMMKMAMTKVLSCFFVVVILISAMPVSVFAANGSNNSTGNASNRSNELVNSFMVNNSAEVMIPLFNNNTTDNYRAWSGEDNSSGDCAPIPDDNMPEIYLKDTQESVGSQDSGNDTVAAVMPDASNDMDKNVSALSCSVYIKIDDDTCVGYEVYVDGVYKLTEGEGGTPDGYCAFYVSAGTHTIEIRKNGCSASIAKNFECGYTYKWVSMPDYWCENDDHGDEVKFRGIVTGLGPDVMGVKEWYVSVDKWISGSLPCDEIDVVIGIYPPMGFYDSDISKGDRVEVYGKVDPWGEDKYCTVGLNGESYYIKKIDSEFLSINVWTDKSEYKIGETVTIYYQTNKKCTAKLTITKPDGGDVVYGPNEIPASTRSKSATAGYPIGKRTVVFEAWAGDEYKKATCYFDVVDTEEWEVKFQGTVNSTYPEETYFICEVRVDKIISDPDVCIEEGWIVDIVLRGYDSPCGSYEEVKKGDKIEVFGKRLPVYCWPPQISLCGKSSYYLKKIDSERKPNLIIQDISLSPSSPKNGDTVTFTVKIKNQGTENAEGFYVCYYIDGSYYAREYISRLSAGSTTTTSFTWIAECGSHSIKAYADCYDAIGESNGDNNERSKIIEVGKKSVHNIDAGKDFATIQAAIDDSGTGHTITVDAGTYVANVDVTKSLTIKSTSGNPEDTIVQAKISDSTVAGNVFTVTADNVHIDGFTIKGASYLWCPGIFLNGNNCIISNNAFEDNAIGIWIFGYGDPRNNIIRNNKFSSSSGYHPSTALYLEATGNKIYLNNFMIDAGGGMLGNIWSSPSPITYTYYGNTFTSYLGNYWDDYQDKYPSAKEKDNSGIWNTPYEIDGDNDNYPLMDSFENYIESGQIDYKFDEYGVIQQAYDAEYALNRASPPMGQVRKPYIDLIPYSEAAKGSTVDGIYIKVDNGEITQYSPQKNAILSANKDTITWRDVPILDEYHAELFYEAEFAHPQEIAIKIIPSDTEIKVEIKNVANYPAYNLILLYPENPGEQEQSRWTDWHYGIVDLLSESEQKTVILSGSLPPETVKATLYDYLTQALDGVRLDSTQHRNDWISEWIDEWLGRNNYPFTARSSVIYRIPQELYEQYFASGFPPCIHCWPKQGMIRVGLVELYDLPVSTEPKTIYVDDDFKDEPPNHKWNTIQKGIKDANDGDTVIVYDGIYKEDVGVNRSITLTGNTYPVINGSITITAVDSIVEGFNIINGGSGISYNGWSGPEYPNVTIQNNIISKCRNGMRIDWCNSSMIQNNTVLECEYGIWVGYSSDNSIRNNTVSNGINGLLLWEPRPNNVLRDNKMNNNVLNFFIERGENFPDCFIQDIDTSNKVNGKPIYYLVEEENEVIDEATNAGFVAVVKSKHITVEDLTLENNSDGVLLVCATESTIKNVIASHNNRGITLLHSSNNKIENNVVSFTGWPGTVGTGIALSDSSGNEIIKNTLDSNNYWGIVLYSSSNNKLIGNTIANCDEWGIDLGGSSNNNEITYNDVLNNLCGILIEGSSKYWEPSIHNSIYHNNLVDNEENARDESGSNAWDNGYPSGGNYWSDYEQKYPDAKEKDESGIWDTPYEIPGDAGAKDNYPLIKLVTSAVFIEIEISRYYIKEDCDPYWPGVADPYFLIDVEGIDGTFRSPEEDYEPSVDQVGKGYPGPIYIPDSPVSLPAVITIKANDSDFRDYKEHLDTYSFNLSSLPQANSFDEGETIYFDVMVREVPATPLDMTGGTNDDLIGSQWYWYEVGVNQVRQEERFWSALTTEESEIIVAVLDTGVNYSHPDLDGNIWQNLGEIPNNGKDDDNNGFVDDWNGYDFIDNDPDPMDEGYKEEDDSVDYHGTNVAGIIAAEINNSEGIAGVAPNVKIMPLRVIPTSRWEEFENVAEIAKAIKYATDQGAKVISMSLGDYKIPLGQEGKLREAIDYAYEKGVILIAAAGNERTSKPHYSAVFNKVVSVSALERIPDTRGDYLTFADAFNDGGSNYGPSLSNPDESIQFSAPGKLILTTCDTREWSAGYFSASGTSMAAPIVSAVAAMVLGYAKSVCGTELTPDEVRSILHESATDLGASGWDPYYGYGMVNAYQALQKVDDVMPLICVKGGNENYQPLKVFFRNSSIHVKILKPLPPSAFTYTLMRKKFMGDEEIARRTTASYDFDMDIPRDAPIGEYYIKIEDTEIQSDDFYIIFNPEACVSSEFSRTDLRDYWSSEYTGQIKGPLWVYPKYKTKTSHFSPEVFEYALEQAGGCSSSYNATENIARNLYSHLNLTAGTSAPSDVKEIIQRINNGEKPDANCKVFSTTLVALCRAIGIPSRKIYGGRLEYGYPAHAWTECFHLWNNEVDWQVWDAMMIPRFWDADYPGYLREIFGDSPPSTVIDELGKHREDDYKPQPAKEIGSAG